MTQSQLLIRAFLMIVKSGIYPKTPVKDWVKYLLFLHKKGYLYASCEGEKVMLLACMYRVPEVTKKVENEYPEKEEGNILFVPFFVSESKDKLLANKLFKQYLASHPGVNEVAFFERDTDRLRRFARVKQEEKNGKR